ncbi:(2Fe-2S)-binding protein [Fodinisporobacter ferrooxydans]|uniref:(2Fe-2S)-binding protein n=1 Tax=Fodinisporobacter ferrooxydans TaxID=2901836 RepID=A0ABY4CKC5_9BACL|nr:(2Fe-2S)-binding protein [Alicyclobacillaceae bacterium MYW30-H2]
MNEDQIVICRCEEVTLGKIVETVEKYHCSSREVKLRTRAGMGFCGGRTCRGMIDRVVAQVSGKVESNQVSMSYRPPVRPVTFGVLAGDQK